MNSVFLDIFRSVPFLSLPVTIVLYLLIGIILTISTMATSWKRLITEDYIIAGALTLFWPPVLIFGIFAIVLAGIGRLVLWRRS